MARAARVTKEGLTLKEEAAVQEFLRCRDEVAAYIKVYNVRSGRTEAHLRKEASKLFNKEHMRARIAQIVKKSEAGAIYTAQAAMEEALEAYDLAKDIGQPAAMVAAVKLRAQLTGVLVEKRDVTNRTVRELDDAEVQRRLQEAAKNAGLHVGPSPEVKH